MVQQRLPWACTGDAGKGPGRRCRAVALGAGPVGLLGAMALRVAGFEVTVYSRSSRPDETNEIVSGIGGRFIAAESHSVEDMAAAAGPIDVVYEAVGASGVAFEVIKQLGPNGVFIFTGVPGRKGPIEIDTDHIMRDVVLNNQAIIGSVNAPPQLFQAAIAHLGTFVSRWPQAIRSIITARFPIQQALEPLIVSRRRNQERRPSVGVSGGWIDISMPLRNGMVQWPGDARFEWRETLRIAEGGACNLSELRTCVHIGTHMDAPKHFLEGGARDGRFADRGCGGAGPCDRDSGSRADPRRRTRARIGRLAASGCCSRPPIRVPASRRASSGNDSFTSRPTRRRTWRNAAC